MPSAGGFPPTSGGEKEINLFFFFSPIQILFVLSCRLPRNCCLLINQNYIRLMFRISVGSDSVLRMPLFRHLWRRTDATLLQWSGVQVLGITFSPQQHVAAIKVSAVLQNKHKFKKIIICIHIWYICFVCSVGV